MKEVKTYEGLALQIKEEINNYLISKHEYGLGTDLPTATREWFSSNFEEWLVRNHFVEQDLQSRSNLRIDLELPIRVDDIVVEGENVNSSDSEDLLGTVINISRGGIYFRTARAFQESTILKVNVDLSSVDLTLDSIKALVMVTRCERIQEGVFGVGIIFSTIYENNQEALDLFIFKHLANHLLYDNLQS